MPLVLARIQLMAAVVANSRSSAHLTKGTHIMKRSFLSVVSVASLVLAVLINSAAQAQGPYAQVGLRVVVAGGNGGGYGGYQCDGYNAGWNGGYRGYGAYGGFGSGYGGYGGYAAPYYPATVPYGAGYSRGYQPYREMYLQRLSYGLGF
jgi:hypothetical protein